MHFSLLHVCIVDYLKASSVCRNDCHLLGGGWGQVAFLKENVSASTLPADIKKAIKRKSGKAMGPCLPDNVYCSMCKNLKHNCIFNMILGRYAVPLGV
jgi:hypothetical protein